MRFHSVFLISSHFLFILHGCESFLSRFSKCISIRVKNIPQLRMVGRDGFPRPQENDDDDDDDYDEDKVVEVPSSGNNAWNDVQGMDSAEESLASLNPSIITQLDVILQDTITEMAINTVGYYMREFLDEVSEKWLMNFNNYNSNRFGSDGWSGHLEKMIRTDKHEILVTMSAPKNYLSKYLKDKPNANLRIQYPSTIDPRKIANQILTVRENLCNEIMEDLGSIRNENNEAANVARVWLQEGYSQAQKARRPTRATTNGTPYRDRNFLDMDILITNLAIDLLRADTNKITQNTKERDVMVSFLNKFLEDLEKEEGKLDPVTQALNVYKGPRSMLEALYYKAISSGLSTEPQGVNVLKLTNALFRLRLQISEESMRRLSDIVLNSRRYYKLIKDCGGFSRLDFGSKPKITVVDIDEELRKEKQMADTAALEKSSTPATAKHSTSSGSGKATVDENGVSDQSSNSLLGGEEEEREGHPSVFPMDTDTSADINDMDDYDRDQVFGGGSLMM